MSASIISAYEQYLGRTPNQAEVDYWAGTGKDYAGLANAFVNSAEYQQRAANNTSDRFLYGNADNQGVPDLINNPNYKEVLSAEQRAAINPNAGWGQTVGGLGGLGGMKLPTTPTPTQPPPQMPQQPSFDMDGFFNRLTGFLGQNQSPPPQAQPQQFDPTPYFNAFQQQQSAFMDKWADMAGMNKPKEGVGSGQWGSFGGNTSPVYRPNQGNDQARNGWGGPWSQSNPFAPTL